jgi:hypothetical protein
VFGHARDRQWIKGHENQNSIQILNSIIGHMSLSSSSSTNQVSLNGPCASVIERLHVALLLPFEQCLNQVFKQERERVMMAAATSSLPLTHELFPLLSPSSPPLTSQQTTQADMCRQAIESRLKMYLQDIGSLARDWPLHECQPLLDLALLLWNQMCRLSPAASSSSSSSSSSNPSLPCIDVCRHLIQMVVWRLKWSLHAEYYLLIEFLREQLIRYLFSKATIVLPSTFAKCMPSSLPMPQPTMLLQQPVPFTNNAASASSDTTRHRRRRRDQNSYMYDDAASSSVAERPPTTTTTPHRRRPPSPDYLTNNEYVPPTTTLPATASAATAPTKRDYDLRRTVRHWDESAALARLQKVPYRTPPPPHTTTMVTSTPRYSPLPSMSFPSSYAAAGSHASGAGGETFVPLASSSVGGGVATSDYRLYNNGQAPNDRGGGHPSDDDDDDDYTSSSEDDKK